MREVGAQAGRAGAFAFESHQRAAKAIANGHFKDQIAPINGVDHDEGPRPDTTLEKLASLKTLKEGGQITAATSSQISDGSGALLIASEQAVKDHGLTPRARIHQLALRATTRSTCSPRRSRRPRRR